MSKTWKAVLGVILIFIFGFASGVVCTSIVVQRKALAFLQHPLVSVNEALEKRLTRNLGLDESQKTQVDGFFKENLKERRDLQMQIQPQVQTLNKETMRQVRSVLRPDQAERFNQNLDDLRKRFGKTALNPNGDVPFQSDSPATNASTGSPAWH